MGVGKKPSSLIAFQLMFMYDRLPPLTLVHRGKFELDAWQKRVLTNIDENISTIVSAPTSSGKTVLSTYLATKAGSKGILFVTPTEPLAVQVAAMFSVLKSAAGAAVFKGVGLVVPSRVFPPGKFTEQEVDIVVGTATALDDAHVQAHVGF